MATADDNPNAQDLPRDQQVMSPRAATARGDQGQRGPPQVNGALPPLRGSQDLDGEVRAPHAPQQLEPCPRTTVPDTVSGPVMGPRPSAEVSSMNPGMGQREALASGFLGLTAQPEAAPAPLQTPGVVVTEVRGQAQVQGTNAGGVISGVIRAVQTLPGQWKPW